ncbi:hypothetical protein [Draconibacterium orientale]|uniref:hypothetical protein n=1 Tax=Draconibacterium orientale TaxID=1168034 RepID=UPI0029C079DB|nr:hypothetical protein [Draconibacterium orientale]
MDRQKEFAKVFNFENGQLLMVKQNSFEDDDPTPFNIKCSTVYFDGELQFAPEVGMNFKTAEKRDLQFESITEENARAIFSDLCDIMLDMTGIRM